MKIRNSISFVCSGAMLVRSACILVSLAACGGHEADELSSVAISPVAGDTLFVVNGEGGSITAIDATTDEVHGTIELVGAEYPHHVYLSPDRASLLVALPGADLSGGHGGGGHGGGGGGGVLVLDATTGETRVARRLDAPNHNAIAVGTAAIWTTQTKSPGQVLVLDPQTLETKSTIEVGDMPSEITFDISGSTAFVANTGADTVTLIDREGAVLETVTVGDGPVGAWPGSDGRMYVDNEAGKSISVIDPATKSVVATYPLGFTPALAAIAPNGELWVTDTDSGKLVFLDAGNGTRLGELATGAGAHALLFTPNGTKAYITNQQANSVSVVDVATKTISKTISVGTKPNGGVFRPF